MVIVSRQLFRDSTRMQGEQMTSQKEQTFWNDTQMTRYTCIYVQPRKGGPILVSFEYLFSSKLVTLTNLFRR